jgi:hypothetical protein
MNYVSKSNIYVTYMNLQRCNIVPLIQFLESIAIEAKT